MTLRRAAWLCLGSGAGLGTLAWFARDGGYFFPLLIATFLAVIAGSHLLTAANQMPRKAIDANPEAGQ
jgi:hypothetical protein